MEVWGRVKEEKYEDNESERRCEDECKVGEVLLASTMTFWWWPTIFDWVQFSKWWGALRFRNPVSKNGGGHSVHDSRCQQMFNKCYKSDTNDKQC